MGFWLLGVADFLGHLSDTGAGGAGTTWESDSLADPAHVA